MPDRLRIGIVGCGDVAHRHYLPGLATRSEAVVIAAVADPSPDAAARVTRAVADWSPGAASYRSVEAMLGSESLDGVVNLTPAPLHGAVNRAILEAGVACLSEKPLASSLEEADALIDLAARAGITFVVAPGSAATERVQWLPSSGLHTNGYSLARRIVFDHLGMSAPAVTAGPASPPQGVSRPRRRKRIVEV